MRCGDVRRCSVGATPLFSPERLTLPHKTNTPAGPTFGVKTIGNQQKWHTLRPERSEVGLRSRKLPEDHVVLSSPFESMLNSV